MKHGVKAVVSLLTLGYVFYTIDLEQALRAIGKANPGWLLAALGAFIVSQWLSASRLRGLLAAIGISISALRNGQLYLLGMYYNLLLPGGVGGDGYKVYVLRKQSGNVVPVKKLVIQLLADRLFGLVALVLIASLLVGQIFTDGYGPMIGVASFLAAWVGSWGLVRFVFPAFRTVYARSLVLSLGVQASQVVSIVCIALALGQAEQWGPYLLLFLVSSVVSVIPISIGGMGIRELTFLYGAQWLALEEEQAVAISFTFFLLTVVVSLSGIFFSFGERDWLPQQNEEATSEP